MLNYLTPGRNGPWEIKNFSIDKKDAFYYNLSHIGDGGLPRMTKPGTYTGLYLDEGGVIMSDTPSELRDLRPLERKLRNTPAESSVFISGLGLGIAAKMACDAPNISQVQVMEVSYPLIELVGHQLMALYPDKLAVAHGDILKYKPPKGIRYQIVWHDIWPIITIDYWEEYKFLQRRWSHYADWVGSWARDDILAQFSAVREYKRGEIADKKSSREWYQKRQVLFP